MSGKKRSMVLFKGGVKGAFVFRVVTCMAHAIRPVRKIASVHRGQPRFNRISAKTVRAGRDPFVSIVQSLFPQVMINDRCLASFYSVATIIL